MKRRIVFAVAALASAGMVLGWQPLMQNVMFRAVWSGKDGLVQLALCLGARPNKVIFNGLTPLMSAINTGRLEVVRLLVGAGANVRSSLPCSEPPLSTAARRGNPDIVQFLLAQGADPSMADSSGVGPLYHCVPFHDQLTGSYTSSYGHYECLDLIASHLGDLSGSADAACAADFAAMRHNLEALQILARHGLSLNAIHRDGETLLTKAIIREDVDTVVFLLRCGVDVDRPNRRGLKPAEIAGSIGPPVSNRILSALAHD
jgi:ankyrin repeat protein